MAGRTPQKPTPPPSAPAPVVLPPGATDMDALLFHKLTQMEAHTRQQFTELQLLVGQVVPLLATILEHLEAAAKPQVPIASYAALYTDHPLEAGPPEGELVAEATTPASMQPVGWWGRLFPRRDTP